MSKIITLTQDRMNSDRYIVTSLVNTLTPKVGGTLSEAEATRLIRPNVKVIVKGNK